MLFGRLRNITHNSTFRLSLMFLSLFLISSIILVTFIYVSNVNNIHQQIDQHISYDRNSLQSMYDKAGKSALIESIQLKLMQDSYKSLYLLYDHQGNRLVGNLHVDIPRSVNEWANIDLNNKSDDDKEHPARLLKSTLDKGLVLLNGLDI